MPSLRLLLGFALILAIAFWPLPGEDAKVIVGSKSFTESIVLGEVLTLLGREASLKPSHTRGFGGTSIVFEKLQKGEVDAYPEYTGTLLKELFSSDNFETIEEVRTHLEGLGIGMSESFGFNNSYALGMQREIAEQKGIATLSDLAAHPDLIVGVSSEFLKRDDGWPGLVKTYGFSQSEVFGMEHDLAYRQLANGAIQVIDVYTTDAEVREFDLTLLEDDREFFPKYEAVLLYRLDLLDRAPDLVRQWERLIGTVSREEMIAMNHRVRFGGVTEAESAAEFLQSEFGLDIEITPPTRSQRIWRRTVEHIELVRPSLVLAILVAVPLGLIASRFPLAAIGILGTVEVIQTIPALALLVLLMLPVSSLGLSTVGGGNAVALAALFLYSLLPIVRNTTTGLTSISPRLKESSHALGLSPLRRIFLIDLPLASPMLLAGIKLAAVMNIGFATLGALIGAGGYGQPIMTGLRLNSHALILEGAIPAAVMALLARFAFDGLERLVVPAGLRVGR